MKNDTINLLEPTIQECGGNYEAAMSYDCAACKRENCRYRKGGSPLFAVVGVALMCVVFLLLLLLSKLDLLN